MHAEKADLVAELRRFDAATRQPDGCGSGNGFAWLVEPLCKGPYGDRKIRLIGERAKKAALTPVREICGQAGPIAPRAGRYSPILKTTLLQEVAQSLLGPSAAVSRRFMDTHEEGYGDHELPAWSQH